MPVSSILKMSNNNTDLVKWFTITDFKTSASCFEYYND